LSQVLTDSKVVINGSNMSAYLLSHDLPQDVETHDNTAMTKTARQFQPGLKVHLLTLEFLQDYGSGGPDQTFSPLVGAAAFAVTIKTSSGTTTTGNPEYQGNFIVEHYDPMTGRIGELQKCTLRLKPAGPLTRATS